MIHKAPLYKLTPPVINGYTLDLQKSQYRNRLLLNQHCLRLGRKSFFAKHRFNRFLKKGAFWEWILAPFGIYCAYLLLPFYTGEKSNVNGLPYLHLPLLIIFIKYVFIDFYIVQKLSKTSYHKELRLFFKTHWLEIKLAPLFQNTSLKIQEIKGTIQKLSQQHIKTLTFTEIPDTHPNLLVQTNKRLNDLEHIINAYKKALVTYEHIEKELFSLKQSKDHEQLLIETLKNTIQPKKNKLEKKRYITRVKQLNALKKQADKSEYLCATKTQEAEHAYTNILSRICPNI